MPNWCGNHLTLTHENPEMITRAITAFKQERLLNEFIPQPADTGDSWYVWCVDNWGTKWDVGRKDGDGITSSDSNSVSFDFDSAWSPPIRAYEKLMQQGFDVHATYYEPGNNFVGEFDGSDDCYEIPETADEVADEIPKHLDEEWGISEYMRDCEEELEEDSDEDEDEES